MNTVKEDFAQEKAQQQQDRQWSLERCPLPAIVQTERGSNLRGARIYESNLNNALFVGAAKWDSDLLQAGFDGAEGRNANLMGAIRLYVNFFDNVALYNIVMPDGSIMSNDYRSR